MCWNAPVSLTTFIVGSVLAILIGLYALQKQQYMLAALSFGWLWPISMQLWEYFAWKNQSWSWRVAYVSNITQILVLYIVFMVVAQSTWSLRLAAGIVVLVYMSVLLYQKTCQPQILPEDHLHYNWWENSLSNTVYIVSLILLFLFLVRPLSWSIICVAILMIMLLISSVIYNRYVSSLWCFFAVAFPPLALLSYQMVNKK